MLSLSAKIREDIGRRVKNLRNKGILPAVLYGAKIKNLSLEINKKDFEKIYKEVKESSLFSLEIEEKKQKLLVLIHKIQRDTLTDEFIHVDFYQPLLDKEIEVKVPLVFEGESLAVKDLNATLIKDIQELEVIALPQNLPHEIRVDISCLKNFHDSIFVKDLKLPEGAKPLKKPEEVVASVIVPRRAEEKPKEISEEKDEEKETDEEEKDENQEARPPKSK